MANDINKKIKPPIGNPNNPNSLYYFMLRYLEAQRMLNQSEHTVSRREYYLRMFIRWCDDRGLEQPKEITKPILDRYRKHLFYYRKKNGAPLGASAQVSYLSSVRQYFKWLTKENYILYNPASEIELPKTETFLPRGILTEHEAELILNQPDVTTWQGIRDRVMIEVLYSTGIRRMELVQIGFYDLNFEAETLLVRQGKGAKDRMVPIGKRAVQWIYKYIDEVRPMFANGRDGDYLFLSNMGEKLNSDYVSRLIRNYVKQANIGKTGSCHIFRHTMATLMLENGADVRYIQAMLGHAKLSTTQLYTQVSITKLKEVHTRTHPAKSSKNI